MPENSETPLESVRSWVTPTRLFFVRNHFAVPAHRPRRVAAAVEGRVERRRTWTWDELTDLPERTVFATVECAGNGRSFLARAAAPACSGAPAPIGHAEWTGVPLRLVLEQAGLEADARGGAVRGGGRRHAKPTIPSRCTFERSLPLAKALHPDTLLRLRA